MRFNEKLLKSRMNENLNQVSNQLDREAKVNSIVEALNFFDAKSEWVDKLNRDEIISLITNSETQEQLIESICEKVNKRELKKVEKKSTQKKSLKESKTTKKSKKSLKENKEKVQESKQLNEGTSNFYDHNYLPLLVFITYDELEDAVDNDSDCPKYEDFEDEDDFYNALDKFKEDYYNKYYKGVGVLTEEDVDDLKFDLDNFNRDTKEIAYELDIDENGYQEYGDNLNLEDIMLTVEPGYYEGGQIYCEHEKYFDYLSEDVKKAQLERFNTFLDNIQKKYGLTKLKTAYKMSNGETGYTIIEELKHLNESAKKTVKFAVPESEMGAIQKKIDDCGFTINSLGNQDGYDEFEVVGDADKEDCWKVVDDLVKEINTHKNVTVANENLEESKSLKESDYYNYLDKDYADFLDSDVNVYDVKALVEQETDGEYTTHYSHEYAIIVCANGKGCVVDYEAVGQDFDSVDSEIEFGIVENKDNEYTDEQGVKHKTISLIATHRITTTPKEVMEKAPKKTMKVREFFSKYKYNDRCADNFQELAEYVNKNNGVQESCKSNKENKKLKEGYIGQTLQDFLDDCIDYYMIDKIYIYGDTDIVYEGSIDDIPDDMLDAEFLECEMYSNRRDIVTINVDSSEEYGVTTYYNTVEDFIEDCNNDTVVVWDIATNQEVFRGYKDEIPDDVLDMIFCSYDTPEELSVNLNDYEGSDFDDFDDEEEIEEALGKVQEITRAVDVDGNEYHVKPIWKTDRLATLVDKDGNQKKVQISDLRQEYDLYDQDDEVISKFETYNESLNEDKSNDWENYGDINFLTYGGELIRKLDNGSYQVISLRTPWWGLKDGEYIIGELTIDPNYIFDNDLEDERSKMKKYSGLDANDDYSDEAFICDLISYYGVYELGGQDAVVDKDDVIQTLKDYDVDIDTLGEFDENLKEDWVKRYRNFSYYPHQVKADTFIVVNEKDKTRKEICATSYEDAKKYIKDVFIKKPIKEANDDLQTKATKMLSEKKYYIDMAWKNGKTWKTEPMTLKEIGDQVDAKVTEQQFVDMMSENIKNRKDAKNLTKAEIVKVYDYIDGQWQSKDVLWSIEGKTPSKSEFVVDENLKEDVQNINAKIYYEEDGEPIIVFKSIGDRKGNFDAYVHNGQHTVAAPDYVKTLKKANLNDQKVKDLIAEYESNYPVKLNLKEDTVKQDGKWVNKGNTGETHGTFKTKKEADAQRKAMFVNKKPNAKWGK